MSADIPPGRPGALDESQKAALAQLKQDLVPAVYAEAELPDDTYLCRFLRARDWHVKKTTQMLDKCHRFRQEKKIDKLWDEWDMPREEKRAILQAWPQYFHKQDKEGRPLYIQQTKIDPSSLFKTASQDRLCENFLCDFEGVIRSRYPACAKASGRPVDNTCLIMDMEGMSLSAFWAVRDLLAKIITWSQDYFPETNGKVLIINGGRVFDVAFAALRPFIAPKTLEKIKMLGYNYQKALLEEVPAESLPRKYGGTCECEGGCEYSNAGSWGDVPPNKAYEREKDSTATNGTTASSPTTATNVAPTSNGTATINGSTL